MSHRLTCGRCKLDFDGEKPGMLFCSKPCYFQSVREKVIGDPCKHCGKQITGKGRGKKTYCGWDCCQAAKIAAGYVTAPCKHCGTSFTSLKARSRLFCTRSCASSVRKAKANTVVPAKKTPVIEAVTIKARDAKAWMNAEASFADGFKVTICPSSTHDPRYQLGPDASIENLFSAAGPGHYLAEPSTWAAAAISGRG